jgi:aminopeptidase N
LDIIASPTLALGVEYPGVIAVASRVYDLGGGRFGRSADDYLESTVVHEVGHQWFYNLVGNDQLDAPWLDESLTQFITLQYYSDAYGEQGADGFLKSLNDRWARSDNYTMPIGLPVAAYNSAEYGAIVYGRGPIFFVALREAMGARAFDDFLKDYTVSLSWGVSSSQTLRSFAERHCGCDLQPLFDEWVYP